MNKFCFKTVFSARLGTLVAVGEHANSQGKANGAHGAVSPGAEPFGLARNMSRFMGVLTASFVWVALAWAQPALNALPKGGQVAQGAVQFSQSAQQLQITQSSDRAAVNWQSFDIGAAAKVNVVQPSAQSVLLNRVGGTAPSQIFGQLQANGKVILVNPNGMVFGQDGSVSAAAFTASTLNISDADFMAGNERYTRDGATGAIVNRGLIQAAPGGYVALLGASVSNEGQIVAPQGNVYMAAADAVSLPARAVAMPMGSSGRIRLELTPASINAAVANQKGGTIVTGGGQVYLQAAALNQAMASVLQSGSIDTTGEQGGAVYVLADGGTIKVDGRITANSTGTDDKGQTRKGGDIVIGRDEETGVLAGATNVSGAHLESRGGFVETSGDWLATYETRVQAKEWLLDPTNITIAASGASGTAYAANYTAVADSVILASDINASLNAGTGVTIATSATGGSAGNIAINESIAKTAGTFANLTFRAHGDITLAAGKTITSTSGNLNVTLNSDFDGNGSGAISMASGSGINSFGGNVTLGGGTGGAGAGATFGSAANVHGISMSGANINSGSGIVTLKGTSYTTGNSIWGVNLDSGATITTTSGKVNITATGQTSGQYGYGMMIQGTNTQISTGSGNITVNATSSANASSDALGIQIRPVGGFTTSSGNIAITGTSLGTAGNYNQGIGWGGTGSVVAGSTGSVSLTGTGNGNGTSSSGVSGARVTTTGASVSITGTSSGSAMYDIQLGSGDALSTSGGNITLTGNSYSGGGTETLNAGSGTVTVQNRIAGTLMDVGGTSADVLTGTLKLGISSAELARITAGTIVAGRRDASATGNVAINAINMGAMGNTGGSLSVLSGGTIAVNDSITKTAGTDATLNLLANNNITVATNKTITASTGKLNVLLNSDSDASSAGSIVFNSGSGVTSNGGNITLGGGSALDGSGTAVGDGVSSYAGISLTSAAFAAGGGNIAMTGTTYRNAATNTSNVHGIVVITNGSINTTGAGTISLKGFSNTITDTLSKGIQTSGVTITGGSTGTVSLLGDSRSATAVGSYLYGVSLGTNTVVTSLGGNIEVTGYGGNGSGTFAANIGVNLSSAKVTGVGAGTVTISGTGGQGAAGSNMGVWTTGASTAVSSQGADITIIGQGGNGASSEGIFIGGGTVGVATGTTSANVILTSDSTKLATTAINSGTGTTTIQNKTAGTLINVGGADVLNTSPLTLGITNAEMNLITAGTLKIGSTTSGAMTTSATVTTASTTGNLYLQSGSTLAASHAIASGAGLYLQTTGGALGNSAALSGTNVSLDNSNGSINLATGAITSGAGGTAAAIGVSVSGSITATNNLNIYGNQTSSDKGVQISGATTTVSGKNVTIYGKSSTGNGIAQINGTLSGEYLNVTGNTNGTVGFALQGGAIKTTGTTGTSTASIVKGISTASGNTNGYGAFMLFTGTNSASAASGTTLTLAGEATAIAAAGSAVNTNERGFFVQGYTLVTSGDVTLDGSSKGSEGVSFGGTLTMATVAGVTNKLTIKGTAGALSNAGLNAVNFSGSITGNASTSSINIIGEAKNLSGINYDKAVNTSGTITGSSANVNIQALYGKVSIDGAITGANISVDNTGGTIDATTGAITAGAGTSLYTNAVNINKALTATGNINVLGKVATTTHTGVNLTATAPITSSGAAKTINVDSTGNIANAAAIKNSGSTGTGANINITSSSGTITGAGAIGDTTNKNASVTFTHAASSTYSGAINAANFTKAGVGALTLDSWVATTPVATNISNAYTIKDGSNLTLSPGATYAALNPASVNVENTSTFSINPAGNGWWKGTAFNFTGASGGGTLNLGGNPIGSIGFTNTFSTNGGATNTVTGLLNSNSGNVDFTLANATSGTALLDGSFAAIAFTQSTQGGYGLKNATTINMSGGGNLLFKDKIGATTFNINAGNVQVGDGSAAITAATATLDATNLSIAAGSKLTFNRAEAYTNASAITGAGSLIQAGAGVVTLTGNSSAFAGAATVNAGKTLAIGTGGSLGAAGSTLALADSAASLLFTESSGTSTVGSTITGLGAVSHTGAGTGVLTADNSYAGATAVSGGTLQIGNSGTTGTLGTGGAVALTNSANLSFLRSAPTTIANNISGTGNVSATITGAASTLTVSNPINLTGGATSGVVNLAADNNIPVAAAIATTNTTSSAVLLNAGKSTNVGTSTGGDISFSGSGTVTVGSGGRATLMTGSVSGSTGLTTLVATGNFRYNSDETSTNYTTALGAGLYGIYREAPTLTATLNNATKTYDGLTFTGGNGIGAVSGYANGDTAAELGSITYGGTAQSVKNAGTYTLTGTAASTAGYSVSLTAGTLTVNKANLTLSGTRVYDQSTTFAGTFLMATGVNAESFSVTGSGNATNLSSKNVQTAQVLNSVTGLTLGVSNGVNAALSGNYNALTTTGSSVSVTAKTASYTATATNLTYNGSLQNQTVSSKSGFISGDALTFTGEASGTHANTYASNLQVSGTDANNYNVTRTNANLVIGKANLTLSGTRVYDQGTTFAGTYLTATGVNAESFAVAGAGSNTNLSSKNVQTAQVLNSVTGLTLGVSNGVNAALSGNYNGLSVTASSVNVTVKSATVDATPTTLTYNGLTQTQQAATSSGFIAGDAITITGLATGKNFGTHSSALAVSGADAGNYNVTRNDANLQITKATLTATGNSSAVTYNGASQSVSGYAITGLVGSDTVSDLTNNIVASGAAGQNAGSYTNTVTAGAQTNYTVSTVNGTLAIHKAPLTATGKSSSLTYNGFNQSVLADFDVTGLQGSDTKASLSSVSAFGATGKNVGDYTNAVSAGTETNYTVTPVNGTLQIGKAGLTATGNSANVTYNGTTQTVAGFTVSGLLGSDLVGGLTSISASGASGQNAASYTNAVTAGTESNYTVTAVNGSLQIGKANLTLAGSKVYNANTSFAGSALTATGVAGETFTVTGSGDASNLASKNVQSGQLLGSATGLSLGTSSNGGLSGNYNALSTTGSSVSVTPAAASVTGTLTNVTYNGSTQTQSVPTTSGFFGGDVISVSGLASGKNASTYTSNLSVGGADAGNYTVTYTNRNLVVAQAPLTVTATQVTKTYDASLGAAGNATVGVLAGAAAGDAVNNAGAQAFLNKDAGIGKSVRASGVTIKDGSNADMTGNYAISYVDNTTSVINMASLTVTANNDARFVTQSDAALFNGVSYSGLVGGETSTVLGGALSIRRDNDGVDVAANTYPGVLVPSGLISSNYNITFANGNYRIVPANQVLIKTTNQSVVYGAAPTYSTTAQYVLDDGVNPSSLVTLSRTGSANNYTFSDGAGGSVSTLLKPYLNNVVAGTSGSTNTVVGTYDVKDANPNVVGGNFVGAPVFVGTLTVGTKPVTPSVTSVSKGYDGTTSMNNVLVGMTGKITGDSLSIGGAGAFTQKNVGTGLGYTISNIALSGGDAANYHLSGGATNFSGADGAITAAPLVLTTSNVTKTYDRTTTATGTTVATQGTQIFGSDSLAGGSFAFTNANAGVGSKTVTVSGVTVNDGNGGANYTVTYANNTTSTINPKALGVTYSALSKAYNGSATASVSGASADIIVGDTVNFSNTSATFDTKNVGSGKTVTVSGIGISGADAGNYSLPSTSVTTTADITAKALTASFSGASKAYDGGVVANVTGSSSDKVTGDVLTYFTTSASFDNKNVGTNKQITVSGISLGGTDAGNYALQNTNATATGAITRKDVTLSSITAVGKTYDGTVAASITASPVATGISGEALSVSGSGTFDSKNAGSGKTVTVADVSTLSKVNGTGDWANYNLVTTGAKTTTANIAQAALTVTASAVSKTYDTTLSAGGSGVVSTLAGAGDVVSGIGSQTFLDKNAGTGKTLRALGVTIKDASNADTTGNYLITYVDNTGGVINKAPLEITANSVTKTYDGTVSATGAAVVRTGTVFAGDALSGGTFAFTDKNQGVGNKTLTVSGVTVGDGVNTGNYDVTYITNTASTINKAPLTVTANAVTKTYDGTLTATGTGTAGTLAGAGAGETVNVAGSLAFLNANAGTGKTVRASGVTIKDTGNADVTGNYNIAYVDNTNSVINQAALTASLLGPISKQYDGTTVATGLSNANFDVTGWANVGEGASVNLTTATYASPNVSSNGGTGALSTALLTSNFVATVGTNLANYTLPITASGNVGTITPAPLTVKVNNTAMFVTQDPNTAIDQGFTYTGLKNGETAVAVLGALSRNYTGAANPAAGNYGAVYDLTTVPTAGNYTVTVQKADLVVARADQLLLSIATPAAPTIYGMLTSSTAGASATGVTAQYCLDATNCNGLNIANLTMSNLGAGRWRATDAANSTISFNTLVDTTAQTSTAGFVNAGNYAYGTSSLSTTGTVNFNGSVVSGGVLNIDPKALTLNATNVTKVYDGTTALAGSGLTPTGTLSGDQISVTSSGGTFAGKNVGSQNFSFTGLQLQGADRANYTFSTNSVTGTGSITPKTLTLSASASNKVYDGSASASVGALSVSGVIAGDTVSATGGTASFSDKNVARNGSGMVMAKPVSISGVTLTGADAGNYQTDSGASATATITPLTLSASAVAQNKVYDGTSQAQVSGVVTGVLGSDVVSVTSTSSTFASKNVVRDAAGLPAKQTVNVAGLMLAGTDAGNYNLASATATSTATITPKALSASGAVANKVYDGSAQASLTGLDGSGLVGGDAVMVQASSAAFSDKNVARDASGKVIAKTVTVTGLRIGGADANNYTLMGSSFTAQASILPKNLNVVATAQDKAYDGSAAATGSVSANNVVAGDALQLNWAPGNFASKDVSRNAQGQVQAQAVSFGSLQMAGADVGNYSLNSGTASTTATITPKTLQASGTVVADKPEDGNTAAQVTMGTLVGLVGSEQLTTTAEGNFDNASAGSNKPVQVQFRLLDGLNAGKANNYNLPTAIVNASITPLSNNNNAVKPNIVPIQRQSQSQSQSQNQNQSLSLSGKVSPLRVFFVKAQAAVGSADLESKNDSPQACSSLNVEKCACEETAVRGVEICTSPVQNLTQETSSSESTLATHQQKQR